MRWKPLIPAQDPHPGPLPEGEGADAVGIR